MSGYSDKIRKAAAIAAAGTAAAGIAAYATTKMMIKIALDRKGPGIMKYAGNRISGSDGGTEYDDMCKSAAKTLEETPHELVRIMGRDNVELVGHFFPCENAKRVIIAFHGWRSSWNIDFGMISDFWHDNGCSVLYAEQRGQNNSGGEYMGFGLVERFDCPNWINWVMCRCGKDVPIYLAGVSMGASTVLMASDLGLPSNVCGIMADCGFTSPKAIWKHIAKNNLHVLYGIRSYIADIMCRRKLSIASDGYSTVRALSGTDIPVLFVHGADDNFVPVEMTYENYRACASPKRILIVPGADHAMSYCVNRDLYEKTVMEFWNDFDGCRQKDGAQN